ncbi:MAG: stage II sporulation protein R [Clostridia bacterium]|nr:stage II sporulation protein R [Clostridia bacterium]
MRHDLRLLEAAALCAMALTVLLSVLTFQQTGDTVRAGVLRLHVIAHSDAPEDQQLKLAVRDALLKKGKSLAAAETKQAAERSLADALPDYRETARQVIAAHGYDYDVTISLKPAFFPTRTYGDVTLPAGTYDALRVVIGDGKGQNWWCVMFPPLCLPAAQDSTALEDVLNEDACQLVSSSPRYELRFWIVEQWEKLFCKE